MAVFSARFPIRPAGWPKPLLAHSLLLLGIALVHGLGVGILYHYFEAPGTEMATYQPWQHAGHFLFGDDMLLFDMVAYAWLAAGPRRASIQSRRCEPTSVCSSE